MGASSTAAELPFQALARSRVGAEQGVFAVAEDGTVLASLNGDRAFHPASVVKVAATLALLRRLGPEHRFETALVAAGPLETGTIQGDLLVEAEGDPALVFEDAFLMLLGLRAIGVRGVSGGLRVRGPLIFNWRRDPGGSRLRLALEGRAGAQAWETVRAVREDAASVDLGAVALAFGGRTRAQGGPGRLLVVHRSAPLHRIVKSLNCYSNNVFHLASLQIGGAAEVEQVARESVPEMLRSAIVIDNAAGSGQANRLSPRATVALLQALRSEAGRHGLSLTDVLPVAGVDPGTLEGRFDRAPYRGAVVAKTGTFGSIGVSALAGVARTETYGEVTFAILNRDLPVAEARRRQDSLVQGLLEAGGAVPWPYSRVVSPLFTRAEVRPGG